MLALSTILDGLNDAIRDGLVTARRHPTLPLTVYNYTNACQYAWAWTPITTAARGLVIDDHGQVVARPWAKIFNAHEHDRGHAFAPPLPDEPFEVYEKVDGSLAIIFWYQDTWRVATRSTFESAQAQWAQAWLDKSDTSRLIPGVVYLAEAVYPLNRIVVDYGPREDLVLLGATRSDGSELRLAEAAEHWQGIGSVVTAFPPVTFLELSRRAAAGLDLTGKPVTGIESEGWVIRYESGLRVKVKNEDYVRLAAVVGEIGTEDVWRWTAIAKFGPHFPVKVLARMLSCPWSDILDLDGDFEAPSRAVIEQIPDEYYQQYRDAVTRFEQEASAVVETLRSEFDRLRHLTDRTVFSAEVRKIPDPTVQQGLFLLFDGRDRSVELHAWKAVRPKPERLFRTFSS